MMRKQLIGAIVLLSMILISPSTALSNEDPLIRNALQQFFAVLKSGNITAIEAVIGGEIAEEMQHLLRNNREYGNFLRRHYQNAEFQIEKITQITGGVVIDLTVSFSPQDVQQYQLFLAREQIHDKVPVRWRIVRQEWIHFQSMR